MRKQELVPLIALAVVHVATAITLQHCPLRYVWWIFAAGIGLTVFTVITLQMIWKGKSQNALVYKKGFYLKGVSLLFLILGLVKFVGLYFGFDGHGENGFYFHLFMGCCYLMWSFSLSGRYELVLGSDFIRVKGKLFFHSAISDVSLNIQYDPPVFRVYYRNSEETLMLKNYPEEDVAQIHRYVMGLKGEKSPENPEGIL